MADIPELDTAATLPTVLRRAAGEFGDETFLVTECDRVSFREVEQASRSLAKRLVAEGVGKGTRARLDLPSSC